MLVNVVSSGSLWCGTAARRPAGTGGQDSDEA